MKLLTILALSISLSGCFWQSVNSYDMEKAQEICRKNNSVVTHINAHITGEEFVYCSNRQVYNLDKQ